MPRLTFAPTIHKAAITAAAAAMVLGLMQTPAQAQNKEVIWLDTNTRIEAGQRALRAGDAERAIRLINKGLKGDMSDRQRAVALNNLCIAYEMAGDIDAAIEACDAALELRPNWWLAFNNRANAHYAGGDYLAALGDYETALELNPGSKILAKNIALVESRYTASK